MVVCIVQISLKSPPKQSISLLVHQKMRTYQVMKCKLFWGNYAVTHYMLKFGDLLCLSLFLFILFDFGKKLFFSPEKYNTVQYDNIIIYYQRQSIMTLTTEYILILYTHSPANNRDKALNRTSTIKTIKLSEY